MKRLTRSGLWLALMLVLGMSLAEGAAATPLWLICLEGSNSANTKYEDSSCTKAQATGKWESVAIGTKSDTVKLVSFTLRMTDTKATGGQTTIRCKSKGWGLIKGPNTGVIFKAIIENSKTECERVEGGCKAGEVEKIEGVDLPWKTEIFETEGKFIGKAEADGNGEPGWKIECNTLLGKESDTCTSEGVYEEAEGKNVVSSGVLLITTTALKRRKQDCTQGGKESGEIEGQGAVLLWTGLGLSIHAS